MNNQTCCFTGHDEIPADEYAFIQKRLEAELKELIHQDVRYLAVGGKPGFDTMAALTVLKLRKKYTRIKLILFLPCRDQARAWCNKDIKIYNQILNKANETVYTSEYYYNGCIHKRNRHLVDSSSYLICYLKKDNGGTRYTVDYAMSKGLTIINLT